MGSSPDTYTIPHHPPKLQLVHFSSTQHQTAPSTVSKKSEIFQSINMSFQDKAQAHITQIDKELSKYPVLNNLEKQTSVPKVYAFLGLIATYFFFIFFNIGGQLLTNVAGFIIPGYYSLEALFSVGKADDTQWLTYWVVFAFLTVFESLVSAVYWFPFYYTFKFIFVLWLALPVPAELKSSSAHSSSQYSPATSLDLVPLPPTSVPRLTLLVTRPCKRLSSTASQYGLLSHATQILRSASIRDTNGHGKCGKQETGLEETVNLGEGSGFMTRRCCGIMNE